MTDTTRPATPKRGRPLGLRKTGGRQKGTPNRSTAAVRDFILKHADPFPLLAKVVKGRRIKVPDPENPAKVITRIPTMDERIAAARVLAPKIAPDMRENTLKGDGMPLAVSINLGPGKAA